MDFWVAMSSAVGRCLSVCARCLRVVVLVLAGFSGLGVLVMMLVTCVDVGLRIVGRPLTGAMDIVQMGAVVTIACALPYTTAVKGHVAIEYFFHKLSRPWRIVVDSITRIGAMSLFSVLAWQSVRHGSSLRRSNTVTPTLQIPEFWAPYVIALCCAVVVLVILHNLMRPGKEMITP